MHKPELMSRFLNVMTEAFTLTSNLCNGKPFTFNEFENSVGYKLFLTVSVPSSLLTLPAKKRVVIWMFCKNFLMAIEFISSQSQFSGV